MRLNIALILSILAGGCSFASVAPINMQGMVAADGMALMATGKTISDHLVSYTSGKNCSTVRRQIGQNFCEEDDLSEPEEIYCYNSLGDVNCFETSQPFGQQNKTVDHSSGRGGLIR